MKFIFGIFSLVCVLGVADAYGAASVRSLGGAGTFAGSTNAINSVRAGSSRVMMTRGGTSGNRAGATAGTARVAGNQRLSIGRYLNGGKSISGGSSIKNQNPSSGGDNTSGGGNGGGVSDEVVDDLQEQIDDRYTQDETDELLDEKQGVLTPGDGIAIDNTNEISVRIGDGLEFDTDGNLVAAQIAGKQVMMRVDNGQIQWKYDDTTSVWTDLVALTDLTGANGAAGTPGESAYDVAVDNGFVGTEAEWLASLKGADGNALDLADYRTETQILNLISNALNNYNVDLNAPDTGDWALVSMGGTQQWIEIL